LDTEFAVLIFVSILQLIERQAQSNKKVDDPVACHNDEAPYSYMTKLKGLKLKVLTTISRQETDDSGTQYSIIAQNPL
jgi:hypothetical protein